jgi:hypothetical protein
MGRCPVSPTNGGKEQAKMNARRPLPASGISFADARYVTEAGGFQLAGAAGALSDHAAVLAWVH